MPADSQRQRGVKRKLDQSTPKKKAKKQKTECKIYGHCTKTMRKCKIHRVYLCQLCHPKIKKGITRATPSYLDQPPIKCTWGHSKNLKSISYPKHNKRYHFSTSKHMVGFTENTSNASLISFANNNESNNNVDNDNDIVNNELIDDYEEDIDLEIVEEKMSENILYLSNVSMLEISECMNDIHISPKKKQVQQKLEKFDFKTNTNTEIKSDSECKNKDLSHCKSPDFIHFDNETWSTLKQIANEYKLGCCICFRFDNRAQTMYADNEYPLTFKISDFVNNTKLWQYVYDTHYHHPERAGHQYSISRATNSNYFNDEALSVQSEGYLHMIRYREPDTAYTRTLHLMSRNKAFPGNIGLSKHRMDYFDNITHRLLKSNVTKQINKPRPWGGPNPFLTTADIYSSGTMSCEMQVLFKMLPIPEKLVFIAIPFDLSPITSKDGQSKTLKDSAARHLNSLFDIFIDPEQLNVIIDIDETLNDEEIKRLLNEAKQIEKEKLMIHLIDYDWQQFCGDGAYSKKNEKLGVGKIKPRFKVYIDETLKIKINPQKWSAFGVYWSDMHRLAICMKHGTECDGGRYKLGFLCLFKMILLRARTPKNASRIKEIAANKGITIRQLIGLSITRLTEYEQGAIAIYIGNIEFVIEWSIESNQLCFNISTSMPFNFCLFAIHDILLPIKIRHLISQNIVSFPWYKLKSFLEMEFELKALKNELKRIKSWNTSINKDLFPMLSKFEENLKNFRLYGYKLNACHFIKENNVNLRDFGDYAEILETLKSEVVEQLNFISKNHVFCCYEPFDAEQNYIRCRSNHPLCLQWIHEKCTGLTFDEFVAIYYGSKKNYYCPKCTGFGIKKPMNEKEIDAAIEKIQKEQQDITNNNDNNNNNKNTKKIIEKSTKCNNQQILDGFLCALYPKTEKKKKEDISPNPDYTENERKEIWIECVDGMLDWIQSLIFHLYGSNGLFSKSYFVDFLPFYMLNIFDIEQWTDLMTKNEIKNNMKIQGKISGIIKNTFINSSKTNNAINKLLSFINKKKLPALSVLHNINKTEFKNELILFINHTLIKYANYTGTITGEELVHKVLFDDTINTETRKIKILIDVAWHHQPYEEYAETVAKLVGEIFSDDKRRMLFDKMRRRTLDNAWLPAFDEYNKLKQQILNQCKVDGIRGIKTDRRASKDAKAFKTIENKSKENALPYD